MLIQTSNSHSDVLNISSNPFHVLQASVSHIISPLISSGGVENNETRLNIEHCTVGQSPKGMMGFIYIGHLSGVQGVEMCAGLLQSVPRGAAECVQRYRVCAGCSFNILPCSTRLNQKIFY